MTIGKLSKTLLVAGICMVLMSPLSGTSPDDAIGFWKTEDEKKGFTTSIMMVYRYNGRLFGRIVVSYDEKDGTLLETHEHPQQRITTIGTHPKLLEVDIFWNLERGEDKWLGGTVFDPRSGRTYACDCWVRDDKLVLRGKFGPFGLNSVFPKALPNDFPPGYIPPDPLVSVPNIPIIR